MAKPKETSLKKLGSYPYVISRLRCANIRTIEQLGRLPIDQLKAVEGLTEAHWSGLLNRYHIWFERNICPAVPPLPEDWKPCTQRGQNG